MNDKQEISEFFKFTKGLINLHEQILKLEIPEIPDSLSTVKEKNSG